MNNILLAKYYDDAKQKSIAITISDYNKLITSRNKEGIADFIFNRLYSRYIRPYSFDNLEFKERYKNGFSMMASFCLLIETLQSFKNGWGDSDRKSEKAFKQFFTDNNYFQDLDGKGSEIYKNVRCGILHQGETTGGWRVTRKGKQLFDHENNTIDAVVFAEKMKMSLNAYREELLKSAWDSEIWDNFRTKMRKVIRNC